MAGAKRNRTARDQTPGGLDSRRTAAQPAPRASGIAPGDPALGAVVALDSIGSTFEPGRIVAVVGANGAGKSTLLRILAGLTGPDSGEVILDGRTAVQARGS